MLTDTHVPAGYYHPTSSASQQTMLKPHTIIYVVRGFLFVYYFLGCVQDNLGELLAIEYSLGNL